MGNNYVCSDLHGCMDAYKAIKAFIKPDDIVYFLGDANDRGPNSWELVKTIYADPQFIYLKGNHEDMLVAAMREYINYDEMTGNEYELLVYNGGYNTFNDWLLENQNIRNEWYYRLNKLPYGAEYINNSGYRIIMTHAGFTPCYSVEDEIAYPEDEDLLWDRYHFNDPWPVETESVIMIHGHTPTISLADYLNITQSEIEPGALWYANNHKICIDSGCVFTGYSTLLNLDTFEEQVFEFVRG